MPKSLFFSYHSGNGKFLTIWFGQESKTLTEKQFLKLSTGFKFTLDSDKIFTIQSDFVEC